MGATLIVRSKGDRIRSGLDGGPGNKIYEECAEFLSPIATRPAGESDALIVTKYLIDKLQDLHHTALLKKGMDEAQVDIGRFHTQITNKFGAMTAEEMTAITRVLQQIERRGVAEGGRLAMDPPVAEV